VEAIRVYPDPVLLEVATECHNHEEAQRIVDKLNAVCESVEWGNCVGMAAPQIGISKRIFVAEGVAYINPKITWKPSGGWRTFNEGCYSLEPERYDYEVKRPYGLVLEWTSYDGTLQTKRFNGERAQVIAHEFDHLDGKLCNGETN
jgi:peptide deformylase